MAILEIKDLTFCYPHADASGDETYGAPALSDVGFSLERGQFCAVCGPTGCGKSTLLRLIKRELAPRGKLSGEINFDGRPVSELDARESASKLGFVAQRPEEQIVCDKVWHELAFGLENLGYPTPVIRRRVAEMASYFGIEDWFYSDVAALSGGQKQLLNLAAVMAMGPEILILDEPTAQLDPIAASDFIATLRKLNSELSQTVLIAEHRLEEVIPASDKLLALRGGRVVVCGEPREAVRALAGTAAEASLPAAVRVYNGLGEGGVCPLTVREGRDYLVSHSRDAGKPVSAAWSSDGTPSGTVQKLSDEPALTFKNVWFRYRRDGEDILRGMDLDVRRGETFCLLGGNGAGKSTALASAAGILTPYAGEIRVFGKKLSAYKNRSLYQNCLALLPQDVQTAFLRDDVRGELRDAGLDETRLDGALPDQLVRALIPLLDTHPYDLSGGEAQLVALAKALACRPKLLLLDEPTKGLDAAARDGVASLLREFAAGGSTVVAVTHDVDFAVSLADRCALVFGGGVASCGPTREFFCGNSFYTTAVNRMTRGLRGGILTVSEAVEAFRPSASGENGGRKC